MRRMKRALAALVLAGALAAALALVGPSSAGAQGDPPGVFELSVYTDPYGEMRNCVGWQYKWDTRGMDLAALESRMFWSPSCTRQAYGHIMGWLAQVYMLRLVPENPALQPVERWAFHAYPFSSFVGPSYVWEMARMGKQGHRLGLAQIAW
jgi:hypothetical protein